MSRASAKVFFKDGTILHGIYNGTVDYYAPKLYPTTDNVWKEFYQNYNEDIDVGYNREYEGGEDCILYNNYGLGSYYIGKASKEDMAINKDYLHPYREDDDGNYIIQQISKEEAEQYLGYSIDV